MSSDILAYIQELIRALIAMVMALVTTLQPGTSQYAQKFGVQCGTVTESQIQMGKNYVENPSLEYETVTETSPYAWTRANLQPFDVLDCMNSISGKCSFYFGHYEVKDNEYVRRLKQIIPLRGLKDTRINISGWGKADAVRDVHPILPNLGYGLGVSLYVYDTNGDHYILPEHEGMVYFRGGTHDFEKAGTTYIAPRDFECLEVGIFFYEDGEAWFDDIEVTLEPPSGPR